MDILFDSERGELVCNNCGLVIEENATYSGPEWRAFDADQRNSRARTGAPIRYTKPNKGLVTEIDLYNKDIRGVRIPSQEAGTVLQDEEVAQEGQHSKLKREELPHRAA